MVGSGQKPILASEECEFRCTAVRRARTARMSAMCGSAAVSGFAAKQHGFSPHDPKATKVHVRYLAPWGGALNGLGVLPLFWWAARGMEHSKDLDLRATDSVGNEVACIEND